MLTSPSPIPHLLCRVLPQVNEQLAEQVESLTEALRSHSVGDAQHRQQQQQYTAAGTMLQQ